MRRSNRVSSNLEQRGLDRCRAYGKRGFERSVALSIVAANVHRLGVVLQRRDKKRLRRQQRRQPRWRSPLSLFSTSLFIITCLARLGG